MKVVAIIPARYESIRFPGKPLAKLGTKYIIQHVYERVQSSGLFTEIIVGTEFRAAGTRQRGRRWMKPLFFLQNY